MASVRWGSSRSVTLRSSAIPTRRWPTSAQPARTTETPGRGGPTSGLRERARLAPRELCLQDVAGARSDETKLRDRAEALDDDLGRACRVAAEPDSVKRSA